jgi:hypothetical protein
MRKQEIIELEKREATSLGLRQVTTLTFSVSWPEIKSTMIDLV